MSESELQFISTILAWLIVACVISWSIEVCLKIILKTDLEFLKLYYEFKILEFKTKHNIK